MPNPANQDLPERIGPYEITARIGSGSFGSVFEGYHPDLGRRAAIKVLKNREEFSADTILYAQHRSAFRTEVTALVRLKHLHIAPLYDADLQASRPYFAHELIEGRTVATYIKEGSLDVRQVYGIANSIASALQHAHEQEIVHCDVKPSNIMLSLAGRPFLIDFGVAASVDPSGGFARSVGGTPAFMAPEQAECGEIDHRVDVFGLGRVLQEMLAATELESGGKGLCEQLAMLAAKMTIDNRENRIQTMIEVVQKLDEMVDHGSSRLAATRHFRGSGVHAGLAITATIVLACGIATLWPQTDSTTHDSLAARADSAETSTSEKKVEVTLGTFEYDGKPLNQPAETVVADVDIADGPITISGGFLGQYASGLQVSIGDLDGQYLMTQLYPHRDKRHGFEQWWKAADKAVYYGHELPGYEYDLGAFHTLTVTYDGETIRSTLTSQYDPENTVTITRQHKLPSRSVDVTFRIFADHMELQPFRVTQQQATGSERPDAARLSHRD